jgi:hypothetical protein
VRQTYHVAAAGHENEARLRQVLLNLGRPSITDIIISGDGIKCGVMTNIIVALSEDEAALVSLSCEIEYIAKMPK